MPPGSGRRRARPHRSSCAARAPAGPPRGRCPAARKPDPCPAGPFHRMHGFAFDNLDAGAVISCASFAGARKVRRTRRRPGGLRVMAEDGILVAYRGHTPEGEEHGTASIATGACRSRLDVRGVRRGAARRRRLFRRAGTRPIFRRAGRGRTVWYGWRSRCLAAGRHDPALPARRTRLRRVASRPGAGHRREGRGRAARRPPGRLDRDAPRARPPRAYWRS